MFFILLTTAIICHCFRKKSDCFWYTYTGPPTTETMTSDSSADTGNKPMFAINQILKKVTKASGDS